MKRFRVVLAALLLLISLAGGLGYSADLTSAKTIWLPEWVNTQNFSGRLRDASRSI
jgi:hypothetical protein